MCLGAEKWFLEIAKKTKPSLGWPFHVGSPLDGQTDGQAETAQTSKLK